MESATEIGERAQFAASRPVTRTPRLLVTAPADGATNMATDEALMGRARRTGETVYRVYGWSRPTVSLGRNQIARGRYDVERARALDIDFVRRPTGGRAILHHREITYAVAGPVEAFGSLRESYRVINRLLLEALRTLGVDAREAEVSTRAPVPGVAPCFETPVAGEVVAGGRKLVGSAQVRDGGAFLQHGSILIDDDQHLLSTLLDESQPMPAPATIRALTGRAVPAHEFATALSRTLGCAADGMQPQPLQLEESLIADVQLLIRSRYAGADWTWRR
jgi:lipoyl(octanoyl) transferase